MRAGVATENGLELRDIPRPEPKPFQILVRVKAAGLNRADLAASRGSRHGRGDGRHRLGRRSGRGRRRGEGRP
jgi:NADPH2:quinone reductase